jgi:hypothetical protein
MILDLQLVLHTAFIVNRWRDMRPMILIPSGEMSRDGGWCDGSVVEVWELDYWVQL